MFRFSAFVYLFVCFPSHATSFSIRELFLLPLVCLAVSIEVLAEGGTDLLARHRSDPQDQCVHCRDQHCHSITAAPQGELLLATPPSAAHAHGISRVELTQASGQESISNAQNCIAQQHGQLKYRSTFWKQILGDEDLMFYILYSDLFFLRGFN